MKMPREFVLALVAALVSVGLLTFVLTRDARRVQRRWTVQVVPRPHEGQEIFTEKGCAQCHGADAAGTDFGPALRQRSTMTNVPRLVAVLWNHAPRMWEAMESHKLEYPSFSPEESAQLIAYLYTSGFADAAGNAERGEQLFAQKHCSTCHQRGVVALAAGARNPLDWSQSLWNHAAAMSDRMAADGIAWPRFGDGDLRDLFAYVQRDAGLPAKFTFVAGNSDNGWRIFQQKSCGTCHDLSGRGAATTFGEGYKLPPTFSEFGGALLNHMPKMRAALRERNMELPSFEGQEMSELAVFLYTLHYLEPGGSPQVGRSVFAARGCSRCHGNEAEGTANAPALRGRASTYTAANFASGLWKHGTQMREKGRREGYNWPALEENDVGNLLAFLNTPPEH